MREVIAGCKLAVGDERAKTAKCEERAKGLADRVLQLTDLGRTLNRWQWIGPLLAGGLALVLGGLAGFGLGFGLRIGAVSQ